MLSLIKGIYSIKIFVFLFIYIIFIIDINAEVYENNKCFFQIYNCLYLYYLYLAADFETEFYY